uniref:Uncharacterized protein n=1 Tax=Anopheles atroparvus TaxID=41427 RepID=A0A182IT40_ANOAO
MPLDMSVKVVRGLVEIYQYNLKCLGRSLQLDNGRKISFKRKEIEFELHVKNKRLKENINSLNLDNLYCLDFDNDVITEEQIIQCLLTNKHQTSVRNIADITIREAPPAIAYNTIDDQDDDFGPVTDTEMEQFYFPSFETNVDREPLREEQSCEPDEHNFECEDLSISNECTNRNSMNYAAVQPSNDVSIQPLDDEPMEMVPVEPENLPPLFADNYQRETNLFSVPDAGTPNESATTPANNETPSLVQSTIADSTLFDKTWSKKSAATRQTKLSAKHMEQSTANYWKLQRKRPNEELLMMIGAKKAEKLHHKPLRPSLFSSCFERFPKKQRSQHTSNRRLLLQELGLKSRTNSTKPCSTKHSEATGDNAAAEAGLVVTSEPITFSASAEPENRLIGRTSEETLSGNECYVSDDEMLNLLHGLWDCVPNGLPFDMVKSHIKNRFTAASVFAHLLGKF